MAGTDELLTVEQVLAELCGVSRRTVYRWRELLDRTLFWNLPHLRKILAAFERHHNGHRPHMALSGAAPLKTLPAQVTDLEAFQVRRHDRAGGIIHEYHHAV